MLSPFFVIGLGAEVHMDLAVQFNDQLFGRAIEIHNTPINTMLLVKFSSFQLFGF